MKIREFSRYLSQPISDLSEHILPKQKNEKTEKKVRKEDRPVIQKLLSPSNEKEALPIPTLIEGQFS